MHLVWKSAPGNTFILQLLHFMFLNFSICDATFSLKVHICTCYKYSSSPLFPVAMYTDKKSVELTNVIPIMTSGPFY